MSYILKKHTDVLEFNKVLNMLCGQCQTSAGVQAAGELQPIFDFEDVKTLLRETDDAYLLCVKHSPPGFSGAYDVANVVVRAGSGLVLTKGELLNVANTLKTARQVRQWRDEIENDSPIVLDRLFYMLTPNRYLEDKIFSCIKNEDEVSDNASEKLYTIRRKIKNAENNIRTKLDKIIRSDNSHNMLQDAIVTQRDGRFVVPVKSEYRAQMPGLVHGTSTSGATLFVEPMAVVEINNELKVLFSAEQDEINRILADLSAECGGFAQQITEICKAITELDVIFAKAKLGISMKATIPSVNDNGIINLKNVRHPLIDKNKVVPITVELGKDYDSLIITGPNTGGKTVTLKTVGLIHIMAMCGMMIPAGDNSEIAVFDRIFADIGDEQSIEQSLSTFSSHMTNLVSIINDTTYNSLILLDELGAGTDPVEGAALAKAILITLKNRGAKICATTHYAELKSYALDADRVQNAGCEFDLETLQPTYRLLCGVPGRSNAFAISSKLGLPNEVVSMASGMLSDEQKHFESIVASLDSARKSAEKERDEIQKIRAALEEEKLEHERKKQNNADKGEKQLEAAREQAKQIVENTKKESIRLISELTALKKQFNKQNAAEKLSKARALEKESFEKLNSASSKGEKKDDKGRIPDRPLKEGDNVYLPLLDAKGVVQSVNGNNITVTVGAATTRVKLQNIRLLEGGEKPQEKQSNKFLGTTGKAAAGVERELDMRGMACDEGILLLDKYLDDVMLAKLETVTIIHGKGTGVLRNAVRNHLKHHRSVEYSRPGTYGEGEDGVTIVTMKK